MCVTSPGRVVSVEAAFACVDLDGVLGRASLALVLDAAVGDWVLVAGSPTRTFASFVNGLLEPMGSPKE